MTPPAIVEGKLANGMDLVVARTGAVPIATMALVLKGGASTDPQTRAGLAAMVADIATQGTKTRARSRSPRGSRRSARN